MANLSYAAWSAEHPAVGLATFADAAASADIVVSAMNGQAAIPALELAGSGQPRGQGARGHLAGSLDFSAGFPPTLFVKDTDSLGEQIQRAFPEARVVKTLNTNAHLMVDPGQLPEASSVFVSGNDTEAKTIVTELLTSFGHADVIDLGDITTAEGAEMILPIWVRLMGALGTPFFNVKVTR